MNAKIKIYRHFFIVACLGLAVFTACEPEDFFVNNGLTDSSIVSSFTITPIDGAINRYMLSAGTQNILRNLWDTGDGIFSGSFNQEVYFPDAGIYTITHTAIGSGGAKNTSSQELTVAQTDPVAGNLILGGKFVDAEDHAKWTILPISESGASWTFGQGSASIHSDGNWAQEAIYQAVEVIKDKEYTIDMLVSGGSFSDTWFEVYAGIAVPVPGQEYSDNKVMGLSTWDGCATAPFSGKLSVVGCIKNSKTDTVSNVVKFDASGTIYLVIRSGGNGAFPAAGITVTNIEMRGKS